MGWLKHPNGTVWWVTPNGALETLLRGEGAKRTNKPKPVTTETEIVAAPAVDVHE